MTCRKMVDFLMAYLEGELPSAQREAFETHLAECPPCVHYVESYRTVAQLGQALRGAEPVLPADDPPEELIQAVLAARSR